MDASWLFFTLLLVLVLISILSHRRQISPFFALVGGALVFGLLSGLGIDRTLSGIVDGLGHVFSAFGLIILCGAVIAKGLEATGGIGAIAADVRRHAADPVASAGLLGYVLAVPFTCCITAYVMLEPILSVLGGHEKKDTTLLYLAAISSVISYALVYPTPVVIPLVEGIGGDIDLVTYNTIAIPLSFLLVMLLILIVRVRRAAMPREERTRATVLVDSSRLHVRAWAPFLVIVTAVAIGLLTGIANVALINLVMLAGAGAALLQIRPDERHATVINATRHAGVIIFDLVGAGALGSVIVMTGITDTALAALSGVVPIVFIPFLLAALVQTIQGSRVVTAVIVARILSGSEVASAIDPVALILMVGGGACVVSYVTDPFFWLVQRTTGDEPSRVGMRYTLPLAGLGLIVLGAALIVQIVFKGSLPVG